MVFMARIWPDIERGLMRKTRQRNLDNTRSVLYPHHNKINETIKKDIRAHAVSDYYYYIVYMIEILMSALLNTLFDSYVMI